MCGRLLAVSPWQPWQLLMNSYAWYSGLFLLVASSGHQQANCQEVIQKRKEWFWFGNRQLIFKLNNVLTFAVGAQVEKLARQFGVAEDVAYTCETAAHFWLLHVLSRWEKFLAQAQKKKNAECIQVLP